MIYLAHPDAPESVVEADESRADILKSAGWLVVDPPKPEK